MSFKSNEKRILIVVHTNTFFVELFRLAKYLRFSSTYNPIIVFASKYPTYFDDVSRCSQLQIPCLDVYGKRLEADSLNQVRAKLAQIKEKRTISPQKIRTFLKSVYTKLASFHRQISLFSLIYEYESFLDIYGIVRNVLTKQNPSLVVLGGDMVGYDTSVYVNVAHHREIPVVILPSTMSNGLEQAEAYYHDSRYRVAGLVNALAAKMYPKWVFEHRGRKLLRVPGERVFVMECLNLAPPLPWVFNSGFADAIVVESKKMEEYYQACGLPDDQLKLIGSLADDEMFSILVDRNANKINLCKELEISADKPIILFALPPDFLYMVGGRPECDFSEYRELVRFWVQSIAAQAGGYNVIACLHPSVRYEDFKYIEDWGVRIARKGTADLIPLCDIYVASVSSTIRWAIACGIPVINYDVYRYRYTDYVDVKGVITIEEKTDFIECLHKLANDSDYYAEIAQLQEHASSKWGNLDGKAGERLLQLFTSMIDMYSKERI